MGIEIILTLLGVGLALLFTIGLSLRQALKAAQIGKEQAATLEERISILAKNLKGSLSVISEIETEIEKRNELAEKLKKDVHLYEQLKELNQPQVEAVTQTIRGEIIRESKKSIWRNALINFVIALVFFFLGLMASRFLISF